MGDDNKNTCSSPRPMTTGMMDTSNFKLMTFGEKAVGLNFNSTSDKKVDKIKRLFAEVIDLIVERNGCELISVEKSKLIDDAVKETQTAQMWAVKAATWK